MQYLSLIMSVTLIGCTTVNHRAITVDKIPYHYVDSQFRETLELFKNLASTKNVDINDSNLSVTFGLVKSVKSTTLGICHKDEFGLMIIKIDYDSYMKMDEFQREELLFHEFGHCLLDRPHCEVKRKGKPISIMYPHISKKDHYKNHRKEMIDELFGIDTRCE